MLIFYTCLMFINKLYLKNCKIVAFTVVNHVVSMIGRTEKMAASSIRFKYEIQVFTQFVLCFETDQPDHATRIWL